jgi:hypothetical protein
MYEEGSIVTLANSKEYFDGTDTLRLGKGVCGMVVRIRGEEYVVDFGAYGQWNCLHNELEGNEQEAWDIEHEEEITTVDREQMLRGVDEALHLVSDDDGNVVVKIPTVNLEADMARRIKELEREIQ